MRNSNSIHPLFYVSMLREGGRGLCIEGIKEAEDLENLLISFVQIDLAQ
jgi:hypothetical protein